MKFSKIKTQVIDSKKINFYQKQIVKFLKTKELLVTGDFKEIILGFKQKYGPMIAALAKKYPTPFFVFDQIGLEKSVDNFKTAFNRHFVNGQYFYAVKSNWHPFLLKTIVKNGFNLDVSSIREMKLAFKAGAKKVVYTGPGKTTADLKFALKNRHKVIVHLDSFGELARLGKLTNAQNKSIKAGVRIYTNQHGIWSKFGIDLKDLKKFFTEAKKYPNVKLAGIHIHLSWNADTKNHQAIIKSLSEKLKKEFKPEELSKLEFIDLGGGFLPYHQEAYYPWGTTQGDFAKLAADYLGEELKYNRSYYITQSIKLEEYAQGLSLACKKYLAPLVKVNYYFEPGRIICKNAMHLVMRVADVKAKDKIIMDAGINMVGWEGLRYDYLPLVNLTNFSTKEKTALMYGRLCMPDDLWGYSCFASQFKEGDVIAIPYQGAYTFSLGQEFIFDRAPVYKLK